MAQSRECGHETTPTKGGCNRSLARMPPHNTNLSCCLYSYRKGTEIRKSNGTHRYCFLLAVVVEQWSARGQHAGNCKRLHLRAWTINPPYSFGQPPRIIGRFEAPRVRLSSVAAATVKVAQLCGTAGTVARERFETSHNKSRMTMTAFQTSNWHLGHIIVLKWNMPCLQPVAPQEYDFIYMTSGER